MEMEILAIENRIELLTARTQKENGRIVAKLRRKLRKMKANGIDR
jgi:hypothetical protein